MQDAASKQKGERLANCWEYPRTAGDFKFNFVQTASKDRCRAPQDGLLKGSKTLSTNQLDGLPRGKKLDHCKGPMGCRICPVQEEHNSSLLKHRWRKAVSLAQMGRQMMRWHRACGR